MKLYRYSNTPYESNRVIESHFDDSRMTCIYLHEFDVTKETKCGGWIDVFDKRKFVNNTCTKQYAYLTVEEAKVGFIHRKKSQIRILTAQLEDAKRALLAIENPSKSGIAFVSEDDVLQLTFK